MNNLLIEIPVNKSVDSTVESILQLAAAKNWKNPATHDLQQVLLNAGKTVNPVKIIELCRPDYAARVLELNEERSASVLMPCRISVYEKEDGKTYVSLMDPHTMANVLPESVAQTMAEVTNELIGIIQDTIK